MVGNFKIRGKMKNLNDDYRERAKSNFNKPINKNIMKYSRSSSKLSIVSLIFRPATSTHKQFMLVTIWNIFFKNVFFR